MGDQRYRLVFRGEVLEGQHEAVVKKRLAQALKLDAQRCDKLFSGSTVLLKRDADTRQASVYQKLFKVAGARLRVIPAESTRDAEPEKISHNIAPVFEVAPIGTPVLDPEQRAVQRSREVDTSGLELAQPGATMSPSRPQQEPIATPDTHRISVAETGVDLSYEAYDLPREELQVELDWSLAEVGADLVEMHLPEVAEIDLDAVNFDLAPAGSELVSAKSEPPPPPDVSHLSVQELPEEKTDQAR